MRSRAILAQIYSVIHDKRSAARQRQFRQPSQILISPSVLLAVEAAVTVETIGDFTLKGRSPPDGSLQCHCRCTFRSHYVRLTARLTQRLFQLVLEPHDGRALVPIPKTSTSPRETSTLSWWIV